MSSIPVFTAPAAPAPATTRYLYGPWLDFLLLGGGSLLALAALRLWFGDSAEERSASAAATLALANVINHPHFAHSYQIFYGSFRSKLFSAEYPADLRRRYLIIGVLAPLTIVVFMAACVHGGRVHALGLAANMMFFLVGWHYVKQGYGMAMVNAALQRSYYTDAEKRALLVNAYATWIFSWLLINFLAAGKDPEYWGVPYFVVPVRAWLLLASATVTLATSGLVATLLWHRRDQAKRAWIGLAAYAVSLYAWLLIRDPIVLAWVPLFHSLQYLAVVWKFQSNRTCQSSQRSARPQLNMALFLAVGFGLGSVGFWALPGWLDAHVPYDHTVFGSSLFIYLFWIFINVHHYLLDTVMWRKGNPDVARYLFGAKPKPVPAAI